MNNVQKSTTCTQKEWTQKDICSLKRGFLDGKNIKYMSKQLGRSPTALHKALSRFKIRANVPRIHVNYMNKMYVQTPTTIHASISVVILYLKSYGYNIAKKIVFIDGEKTQKYFLDQRPITEVRLLLMANNIRLDERKPIFVIEETD
ncbi:MAG: hypothetical protein LBD36_02475 [Holosporales bacterium]|jgi:hypothetical protein|nr:hypothetical protein [Holosporales bacterium]